MNSLQTPQKDQIRSSSSSKPRKVAKKSLNGALTSVTGDSLPEKTSDSSQASITISDLATPNPTVISDSVQTPNRQEESVSSLENLVRRVRSRKVLEEMIKVAVAEHLAAPPLVSSPAEGIDRILNSKLGIMLISFFLWYLLVFIAVRFGLGNHAGPSPT